MVESLVEQTPVLKRLVEMLNALFKHATEGIIVVNSDGVIEMANPKAKSLFGYEEGELLGQKIEILIPSSVTSWHRSHREGYSSHPHARGMGINMDLRAKRKDGSEFPVEVSLSPFSTSAGDFVVSFVIDITERKRQQKAILEAHREISALNAELEARVEKRTEQLAHALKQLNSSKQEVMRTLEKERELNDMKSKFVTIASHEFRTPLATILSSASLIGRYTESIDDDKRQKHVQRIKSSVNNLTEILNDFLSLGRLEEGLLRNVQQDLPLSDFCQQLVEELRMVCKENQKIRYKHSGELIAFVDKQLLRNVIINLISNAIKYSVKDIELTTDIDKGSISIEVRDQGVGIPEEDLPYIFDRFFRAGNSGNVQGTGLGLNIVKKYIELMMGKIEIESKINEGTTVRVMLANENLGLF